MRLMWAREAATVREMRDLLREARRPLAYTTVMTVMSRLAEKGWLVAQREGRAFHYQPARTRREAEAEAVGTIVRALLHDFGDLAVTQFVKELDEVDPQQLSRLAQLARETEEEQDD